MKAPKFVVGLLAIALIAAVAVPTFTAQAEEQANIVELAVNTPEFSILVEAVIAADLVDALSGPGPLTVFAPSNTAFVNALNDLGITKEALFADTELLTSILLYHVAGGEYFAADVVSRSGLTMLDGNTASIDGATIDGANIIATDIDASNGVIHAIDRVILPPADITSDRSFEFEGTVVDIAINTPEFSILTEAVVAAGLVDTLSSGEWTVFAPSNTAFVNALNALGITKDALFADTELLTSILLYHVIPAEVFAEDAAALTSATMADGNAVTISRDFFGLNINNANVTVPDINVSNGVIHAIDQVLLPPADVTSDRSFEFEGTVVDIAINTPEFSILTEAVVAADLVDTLSGGEWTVFAPSNNAFYRALKMLGITKDALFADTELLTSVLLYHVIPAEVFAEDAATLTSATMADGNTVTISVDFDGLNINDANVIVPDINVSNGVIHAIDQVLLPPQ